MISALIFGFLGGVVGAALCWFFLAETIVHCKDFKMAEQIQDHELSIRKILRELKQVHKNIYELMTGDEKKIFDTKDYYKNQE